MPAAQCQECSEPAAKSPEETKARDQGGREQLKSSRDLPDYQDKRQKGQETPWGLWERAGSTLAE